MAQVLSPADRETYLAAGFDSDEVASWSYCECGSGEPAMFVLHESPVCSDCWNDEMDRWED